MDPVDPRPLVEHFFRHQSGRLVAQLARVFSLRNLDYVEDVVQAALLDALRTWRTQGVPDNPAAWVRRVARNRILDQLRHAKMADRHVAVIGRIIPDAVLPERDDAALDSEIADDQLRMMFACCHPALAVEDQIALTLKTLCGFSTAEIARAFVVSEDAIAKRLSRAKQHLVENAVDFSVPAAGELEARLSRVQRVLYLFFNEGYLSTHAEQAIRQDLCEEAVRLTLILAEHPACGTPATHALAALMVLHAARFPARLDDAGRILLMDEQDRTLWDCDLLQLGYAFLDRSARGERISRYHLEAGIAWEHGRAESLAATDWPMVVKLYDALLAADPSPVLRLNRAIAVAEWRGPEVGLMELDGLTLDAYHLLDAARGELMRRCGRMKEADEAFAAAMDKTRSPADLELLARKRKVLANGVVLSSPTAVGDKLPSTC